MSLISDDKLKKVITEYCNYNIEVNYKSTYYYNTILEKCKNIKTRDSLLELFKEIGWDSKID